MSRRILRLLWTVILAAGCCCCCCQALDDDYERGALRQLYAATSVHTAWTFSTGWDNVTDNDYCHWYGVQCSNSNSHDNSNSENNSEKRSGVVEVLQLSHNGLNGEWPDSVFLALPNLKKVVVADNPNLIQIGWTGIRTHAVLQHVDVNGCGIQSLERLQPSPIVSQSLTTLNIARLSALSSSSSSGTDVLSPVWTCCPELQELQLSYLHLDETTETGVGSPYHIPTEIGLLTKLTGFEALETGLGGTLPTELGRLKQLQTLALGGNFFTGTLPSELNGLFNLRSLDVQGRGGDLAPRLTGPLPSLSFAPNLFHIHLAHHALVGTIPANFLEAATASHQHRKHRAVVNLNDNRLSGTISATPLVDFSQLNIDLTENPLLLGPLPSAWCAKASWMSGLVGLYGCEAILCSVGTAHPEGRRSTTDERCRVCPGQSTVLGATSCGGDDSSSSAQRSMATILAELYHATDGPRSWSSTEGWEQFNLPDGKDDVFSVDWSGVSICEGSVSAPFGVICNANGQVRMLALAANELQGTVPESLWDLNGMEALDLSYNRITFKNFRGLAAAKQLRRLRLSRTDVNTFVGIESTPESLKQLFLDGCEFKTSLPSELFQLTQLDTLHLEASYITGSLPTEVGQLTKLERLSINENELVGALPSELDSLTDMEHLDISDNKFDSGIPYVNALTKIRSFKANHAGLKGRLHSFQAAAFIEELELSSNALTGTVPVKFLESRHSNDSPLSVSLSGNLLEGTLPESLGKFVDLTLALEDNRFSGIPQSLCEKSRWQGGQVGKVASASGDGCNAILCPAGSWNIHGKASVNPTMNCTVCPGNNYFGETTCEATGLKSNSEVDILDQLFQETGGRNWNMSSYNWTKAGVPLCHREGVVCGWETTDQNSGVTELRLPNVGLRGAIPSTLFDLPRLRLIDLSSNAVEMSFQGIQKTRELEVIRLSDTQIQSLDGIENAGPLLRYLSFSSNQIGGPFPSELFRLTDLEHLSLVGNRFEGSLPTELGDMAALTKLSIHDNNFKGPIPTELGKLTKLQWLDIHQCFLTGSIPTEFGKLQNINRLSLSKQRGTRKITGPVLPFDTNNKLHELYLSSNELRGAVPANLLAAVEKSAAIRLDLSYNFIDELPDELVRFDKLNIDVVGNQISYLPDSFCEKLDWMAGVTRAVDEQDRCDTIMCPPGKASPYGRLLPVAGSQCKSCPQSDQAPYFGSLACLNEEETDERDTLMTFYKRTKGSTWVNSKGWMTPQHVCSWFGVTCNERLDVKSLKLENNAITADTGDEILGLLSQLKQLKELDLKGNDVAVDFTRVPLEWGIESLQLSATNLSSLRGISNFRSLKSFHAADNKLSGKLPDEMYKLTGLQQLYLPFNFFNGTISSQIGHLRHLQQLYLFDNRISGTLPEELGEIPVLRDLVIAENLFNGTIPNSISSSPSLSQLQLQNQKDGNKLRGPLPDFWSAANLRYLDLSNNALTGAIPFTFLGHLEATNQTLTIRLMNNEISGGIPADLSRFDFMNLELGGNSIDAIPGALCDKRNWMDGVVGVIGSCDAILCPPGTFSSSGRLNSLGDACLPCDSLVKSPYYGHTLCRKVESERGVLEVLFARCGGEKWHRRSGWFGDNPICSWDGVRCDEGDEESYDDKGVTALSLEANNLDGSLPSQLWSMPHLQEVSINNNMNLSLSFHNVQSPSSSLKKLTMLSVRLETLKGISMVGSLTSIEFDGLSGSFPEELLLITSLEELLIANNHFVGTFPSKISSLTNLRLLHASNNDFNGPLSVSFKDLVRLQEIDFNNNLLSGQLPSELSSLPLLETLSISRSMKSGRKLTGTLPAFEGMPRLKHLVLDENDISGTLPNNFLESSMVIETVDIRGNSIEGTIPKHLLSHASLNLLVTENEISSLPSELCTFQDWMNGEVAMGGCDAILCPPGTYNDLGRATGNQTCELCSANTTSTVDAFGKTSCDIVDEKNVLEEVFQSTDGNNWVRSDFWGSAVDICEWYGVGCREGKVALLNLRANNVNGSLPSTVFDLPDLEVLWIGSNPVTISFEDGNVGPSLLDFRAANTEVQNLEGIGKATGLVVLNLHSTQLSGTFPDSLWHLRNLRVLDLSDNDLSGELPSTFDRLDALRVLHLHENRFSGHLQSFEASQSLTNINVANNLLSGVIPSNLINRVHNHTNVTLNFADNQLSGSPPASLARFDVMTLDLSNNSLVDTEMSYCTRGEWNSGDVARFGCDAIVCPAETWSPIGRRSSDESCQPCNGLTGKEKRHLGRKDCPTGRISSDVTTPKSSLVPTICASTLLWMLVGM